MTDKVPPFRRYLTPGREKPDREEGHSLASRLVAKHAQPREGLGNSTGDRVQSGWVGKNQLTAVLDKA